MTEPNPPAAPPGRSLTSLIIPAYNPGSRLAETLQELSRFLPRGAAGRWEVVFVCDGCTDGSAELLEVWRKTTGAPVRVVSYAGNRGKGYAVRQGLAAARGDWRIFTDVDLAYGLDQIVRVARALWDGADAVIASRTHPQSEVLLPAALQGYVYRRHLQSRVFAAAVRWILPLRHGDTQAGLKGFRAAVVERFLPHLRCDGFGFDCELLTACARFGVPVTEVPVCVRYEAGGLTTTNSRAVLRMLRELWAIRRAWKRVAVPAAETPAIAYRKAV
jgi:glycosyltransferase involved in cell wall biosynthesis